MRKRLAQILAQAAESEQKDEQSKQQESAGVSYTGAYK
jgi:hypothetical protein